MMRLGAVRGRPGGPYALTDRSSGQKVVCECSVSVAPDSLREDFGRERQAMEVAVVRRMVSISHMLVDVFS